VDQNEQRDHAEEDANRALMRDDQSEFPYVVERATDEDYPPAIRLGDDDAELEFFIEMPYVPELVARLVEQHKAWQAAQESTEPIKFDPDYRFAAAKAAGMFVTDEDLAREESGPQHGTVL